MDFVIAELPTEQRLYVYAQSQQISMQAGLIGHLRADMDSDGHGFFTSWFDFRKDIKTQDFKDEFEHLIDYFRFDPESEMFLQDRFHLADFCRSHPESAISKGSRSEYGFRIDTDHYAYLMRLNPGKGEYNLYCYCYKREWLDRHLQHAARGIRFIYPDYRERFRLTDGDQIRIVRAGGDPEDYTARYIDDYHVQLEKGAGSNLYHICELAERLEQQNCRDVIPLRSSLPDLCYSNLGSTGAVIILKKGEIGYYKPDIPRTSKEEAKAIVDDMNRKLGVSEEQQAAMHAGSIWGFHVPAADPDFQKQIMKSKEHTSREER